MVKRDPSKFKSGVRFSYPAPSFVEARIANLLQVTYNVKASPVCPVYVQSLALNFLQRVLGFFQQFNSTHIRKKAKPVVFCLDSSGGERLVYTERVRGSKPCPGTSFRIHAANLKIYS